MTLLLTIPARTERVFLHKFQDAIVLSSWGFVFLVSPVLVAYGIIGAAPWYYYAMLLPCLVAFVYVPAAIGAVACLCVVRRVPHKRTSVLLGSGALVLIAAALLGWTLLSGQSHDLLTPEWFHQLLGACSSPSSVCCQVGG